MLEHKEITNNQNRKEVKNMKKIFMVMFALFISVAFVSMAFAQAKPAATEKPAPAKEAPAPEKAAPAPAKEAPAPEKAEAKADKPKPKPKPAGFYGEVTNVDATAKILTVKTKKDVVTFDLAKATFKGYKDISEIKVGDKVAVKYSKDGINVKKIAAAKPAKEKKEKPAAKKKGFKDIDANKDGKVTIEELTVIFINVTPEMFKQFDKNGDGVLDEKEFGDASKAMK
jgi:outer membrane protein OmpA-like peptidoglycan-associated protein